MPPPISYRANEEKAKTTNQVTCFHSPMPSLPFPSPALNSPFIPNSFSTNNHIRSLKKLSCIEESFWQLCSQGRIGEAVSSLHYLAQKGIRLDSNRLAFLLKQCAHVRSLKLGKWVHLHLKFMGLKRPKTFLANHLINMYGKCGDHTAARKVFDKMSVRSLYSWNNMLSGYAKLGMLKPARKLFDQMPERDVVTWNTMVIAYAQSGYCNEAFKFYKEFRRLDIGFNEYSFAGLVTACVKLRESRPTKQAHCQVLVSGFLINVVLSSSIVDAYVKSGYLGDARRLFDEMARRDILAWTTLISGYAKWGNMESAKALFDVMPERNPVSWTAMITGYALNNMGQDAIELFAKMMALRVKPDQFTFSSCLRACAGIAALEHGKQIHAHLITVGLRPNSVVVSSLVDMYSKCGCLQFGEQVFHIMGDKKKDVVLWNTLLSAFAHHGFGKEVTNLYAEMISSGVKPDRVTFLVLLSACSHSGLVNEGLSFFKSITRDHCVFPDQEHYACLTDMLGRAGRFDEVIYQLRNMPCKPDGRVWNALLGVCRIHGNIELGRIAAKHLFEIDPKSSAAFVFLSNIYAELGRWESVVRIRQLMNKTQVKKEKALSWLETEHNLDPFSVSDRLNVLRGEFDSNLELFADQSQR